VVKVGYDTKFLLMLMAIVGVSCIKEEARPASVAAPVEDEVTGLKRNISEVNPADMPDLTAVNCRRLKKALGQPLPEALLPKCIEAMLIMAERAALGHDSPVIRQSSDEWLTEAQAFGASKNSVARTKKKIATSEHQAAAEAKHKEAEAQKALREEGVSARREMAERMRTSFLDSGLDIKVKTSGRYADRITFEYVLFNDVWSHRFQKEGVIGQLRTAGFKRIDLTDGYDWHVYWD
jgi:hypothetical protein